MASFTTITKDWRGFKAVCQQHSVHSIKSQLAADLMCDLLSVKAAADEQQPLESLALRGRRSDQGRPQPSAATLREVQAVELAEVARQLQSSVQGLARPPAGVSLAPAHTAAAAASNLLFAAAAAGCPAIVLLLLVVWPESISARDKNDARPLHAAASGSCDVAVVRQLLAAAPDSAAEADSAGKLPLHRALKADRGGKVVEAVSLLLAAAPQAAAVATGDTGELPLHLAAAAARWLKSAEPVQLLLPLSGPGAAVVASVTGHTPLHRAAWSGHLPTIRALLEAEPAAATAQANDGSYPLHCAAADGHAAAVALLLESAPQAAVGAGLRGMLPIELALGGSTLQATATRQEAARCLLGAGPAGVVLSALRRVGPDRGWPLIWEAVATRLPLTVAEWEEVPYNCPGIGKALPAVLESAPAQRRHLARRLPRSDLLRLRAFALCLARLQRRARHGVLPPAILQHLLCLSLRT